MDYATLIAELQQPQYADMTDAEAAEALNAPSQPTRREVPARELIATAVLNGAYAAVKAAAESEAAPAQVRGVCASVLVLLSGVFQEVNLDDPRVQTNWGALTQAGVLTQVQASEIDALADVPGRSRAQEIGLGTVTVEDILDARDWLAAQEAEATRRAAYDRIQERLINSPRSALARLQIMRHDGTPAPNWAEVLEWL